MGSKIELLVLPLSKNIWERKKRFANLNTVALNKLEKVQHTLRDFLGGQFKPIDLHRYRTYIFLEGASGHGRTVVHSPFQKIFLFP